MLCTKHCRMHVLEGAWPRVGAYSGGAGWRGVLETYTLIETAPLQGPPETDGGSGLQRQWSGGGGGGEGHRKPWACGFRNRRKKISEKTYLNGMGHLFALANGQTLPRTCFSLSLF
jgi:hypothetical protein